MEKGARQQNRRWEAVCDFFPGLFRNEAFMAVGHGIAVGCRFLWRNLCRGLAYLGDHKWTARWGLLALTGFLMWGIYCAPTLSIHELAARHPSEIASLRATVTVYGQNSYNLNGSWQEHSTILTPEDSRFAPALTFAEALQFRRFIGEPLARLLPDKDGVTAGTLKERDMVLRLQFLDEKGSAYFTLLCYPDACYYCKKGWGAQDKFLPVVLLGGNPTAQTLDQYLFRAGE